MADTPSIIDLSKLQKGRIKGSYTVPELKKFCKERGIPVSKKKKDQLVNDLLKYMGIPVDEESEDKKEPTKVVVASNYVPTKISEYSNQTMSLTFGDVAENHAGMEKIGIERDRGLTYDELTNIKNHFEQLGLTCELINLSSYLPTTDLNEDCQNYLLSKRIKTPVKEDTLNNTFELNEIEELNAYVLVVRNGLNTIVNSTELMNEHLELDTDKKAFMRGRVVNKLARWNLCYADYASEADYKNGKGTVVDFATVPLLSKLRNELGNIMGEIGQNLMCELNHYYDSSKCYIGYHGDTERRIVVCARLGESMKLRYCWYLRSKRISDLIEITLHDGDMYFMSDKAVGYNWKKRVYPTLRHAAGCESKIV